MKKFLVIMVAVIGLGIIANAKDCRNPKIKCTHCPVDLEYSATCVKKKTNEKCTACADNDKKGCRHCIDGYVWKWGECCKCPKCGLIVE